jgi:hypothetical protein
MRRRIESAPTDGKFVFLEDDATETCELARWSAEARAWVKENGELSKITPTYWHPTRPAEYAEYLLQELDEILRQREVGSGGPSESRESPSFPSSPHRVEPQSPFVAPDVIAPPMDGLPVRPDEYLQQQFHEIFRQRDAGSSGPSESRESSAFRFSSDRVDPQSPFVAPDDVAPRPAAIPAPVDVVAVKSQIAPGKAQAGRGFGVSSIAVAMIAASLIGMYFYFRVEVDAYVTQYVSQRGIVRIGTSTPASPEADIMAPAPALRQQAEANGSSEQTMPSGAVQVTETKAPDAEPLEKERRRADASENQLAEIRRSNDMRDVQLQAAAAAAAQSQERDAKKTAGLVQDLAAARQQLTANEVQYREVLAEERDRSAALATELATARREAKTQAALASKSADEAAQLKRAAETATAELQQSLQQQRDKTLALESQLAAARRDVEVPVATSRKKSDEAAQLKQAVEAATTGLQQSVQQERARAEALAGELAKARREVEAQAALSSKKDDEAAQLKRAAETATTGLQQSVQEERERAEALAGELAKAQREVKAQAALSSKKDDEAAQLKRAAETPTAELHQSLQQQRDKTQAIESELAMARRDVETVVATPRKTDDAAAQPKQATKNAQAELRQSSQQERDQSVPTDGVKPTRRSVAARPPLERSANSQTTKVGQAVGVASSEQPAAAEANVNPEAARLVERANALLGQGNIGAARVVLERAAEAGSAQATFRLAETFDPLVLSTWGTYGTLGDATKARELYAKAYDGGIKAAKDRSDALQTAGSEAK